jgi:hypothetical protein
MQDQGDPQFEPAGTFHYFRKAVEVVKLDRAAMAEVAQDSNSIRFGIAVTAIGGVLAVLPDANLIGIAVAALYSVAALLVFAGFVHIIAGYSMGKEKFLGLVRIIALSGIIDWLAIIPLAGLFAAIWSVVIAVVATRHVYHLASGKAILCVLVSASALWLITATLFAGPLGSLYKGTGP